MVYIIIITVFALIYQILQLNYRNVTELLQLVPKLC